MVILSYINLVRFYYIKVENEDFKRLFGLRDGVIKLQFVEIIRGSNIEIVERRLIFGDNGGVVVIVIS